MRYMVDRDFFRSTRFDEQQMRANFVGAHPELLEFYLAFQRKLKRLGIPMFAHAFVRDKAAQTQAYVQGNSLAQWGQSPHNFGMAYDLVHSHHAWNLGDKGWEIIGALGKELALQRGLRVTWGGDWKGARQIWDPAHWQIANWKEQKEFFPWIATQNSQRVTGPAPTPLDTARMKAWELWRASTRTRRQ